MKHSTVIHNAQYIIDSITKILNKVARNVADSIPFSSKKLLKILIKFFIEENTLESKATKNTITVCEAPRIKGEEKYCATSSQKMIDFTTSKLGEKVKALSTDVKKENEIQKYIIF